MEANTHPAIVGLRPSCAEKQGHLSRMCCISELVIMKMAWQITLSCLWLCLQFVRDSPLPFGTNSRDSCGAATVLSCATFAYGKQFGIKCVTMEELWPKSQDRLLVLPHRYWLLLLAGQGRRSRPGRPGLGLTTFLHLQFSVHAQLHVAF